MNIKKKLLSLSLLSTLIAIGSTLQGYVRTIKNYTPYPLNYKVLYYGCSEDTSEFLGRIYPGEKRVLISTVCLLKQIIVSVREGELVKGAEYIPKLFERSGNATFEVWKDPSVVLKDVKIIIKKK